MVKPGCSEQVLRNEWWRNFGFSFISGYSLAMLFCVFSLGLFVEDYSTIVEMLGSGRKDG